jgi:DNA-binding protein HU-beta
VGVNRTELVEAVSASTGLDKRASEAAVVAVVDAVVGEAKAGNKVSIFGFGTFTPTSRAARVGRNPQTGAPVKIAASKGVRFAPSSTFKTALNAKKAAKKAAPAAKKAAAGAKAAPAAKKAAATAKAAPAAKKATAAPAKKAAAKKR